MLWRRHTPVEAAASAPDDPDAAGPPARRPWWRRAIGVLLELLIVVAVAAAIPRVLSLTLHTQYPLAAITSSSMWPTLDRGDLVVVEGLNGSAVEPGQIVVYHDAEDDTMVIHRVLEVEGTQIVTKGDANSEPDDPIELADISGVVPTLGDSPVHLPLLGQITLAASDRY